MAENFKNADASSYDAVAAEFDRFSEIVSTEFAEKLLELADLGSADRVLDIGTGSGVVALKAAGKVGSKGKVVGIDLSEAMLQTARAKALKCKLDATLEFCKMDAEVLEFADGSFDAAVSLFALLHFPDPARALAEVFRVLRPGGKFVVGVGSGPRWLTPQGLAHGAKRVSDLVLAYRGKRLVAPGFLNKLVMKYLPADGAAEQTALATDRHKPRSIALLARQAGFIEIGSNWRSHEAMVATAEDFWDLQRTFSSLARKRLSKAEPEKLDRLKKEFFTTCDLVQSCGGKLVYPSAVFYLQARRPLDRSIDLKER